MAGPDNKGTTRLATLPSDLLDDHAPAFVPGWMAQDKLDKPTSANQNQGERVQNNQNNGGWGNDFRPAKPGWVEEKPRGNENRWDKPGGGPFVERPKPFGAVDDHHHINMSPGGPPMGGKWREDGDRVLPRREPVPRWAAGEDARWMMAPGAPDNFGGSDRWEPKGRGRGGLEPPRRPQEGFPDRWVNPADAVRPRGEKWGPEGEHHEPYVDRWGHRPLGVNGPPMGRGAPGFGPGAGPGGFGEPQHHPMEPGRGRGFAPGRGRGLHLKGPGGVGSPGAFTHNDKWGPAGPGPSIGRPVPAPEGGALIAASDTPPLGSRTAKRLYRKPDLVTIYKRLAAAKALVLPAEVDREDPSLFAEAGQPDVLEVLLGVHQPGTGGEPAAMHAPPLVEGAQSQPKDAEEPSKQEQASSSSDVKALEGQPQQDEKTGGSDPQDAMDEWVYQDPQGVVQGPFTRVDIIEWYEGHFFPPTLPIRSAKDPPSAPFKPLSAMLRVWGAAPAGPPGFVSQEKTEEQQAAAEASAVSQPEAQAAAVNSTPSAVSSQPEQPPSQLSRPETSRFQHVFAQSTAAQPPQEEATVVQRKSFEQQSQAQTAALGVGQIWQQQHFPPQRTPADTLQQHPLPVPCLPAGRTDVPTNTGRPQEHRLVQGQDPLLAQFQSMALAAADRPQGHNYRQEQPGLPPFPDLHNAHQQQEHFPDVLMQLQHPQQQHFQQQQQHLHTQDPLYMQGLERGRALMDALNPQHGFGQQQNMHAPGVQHAPWMQHQANQHFANQHLAHQAPNALPHPEPASLAAWLNDAQPTEAQQQQQQQSLVPQQFLAHTGQHPGQGQPPPQQHLQRPVPEQQQQHQHQQHRIMSDPVINPATLLQAGRVPSGPLPPIGQGVDSRGSSSNNLAQQASSPQMPGNVSDLFPFLQSSPPSQEAQVSVQQQAQAVPQPLPQVFVGAVPGARPSAEAEAAGSRLGAWSQAPPVEAPTAQPEPSSASAPFEKVKGKQRKAKPIAEDPQRTAAFQPYEPALEEQQPKHSAPPMQQPAFQEEQRYVETRPAPWAKHVPAPSPGQKSLLDIQREEAERAAAAQAAEAAEAASRGPVITAGPGGWAKVAAANVPSPYQGNGSDAAMQRAMAASLRDIQEHEERVRKQAQQAQRETVLGPSGEPVHPQGGTLADAFREKGLLAPKQAGWAGNAAAKLAKPAGGLKEVQAQELEQQRKKAAQHKPAAQAQEKQKANDEDDVMFWDYGNPAGSGTAAKLNGNAAAPGQGVNGTAGGSAASGTGKDKQGSAASRQKSKPAEEEPFSGTPMSPEFEAWCKEQMLKLQGQDDLTLVRFLLSCSSTGEVAEYISAYLGKSAEVSKFTSEFLKRKYAEASGKKVKKGSDAAAAAPKVHPGVTAAGAGGGVPSATGWQKLPAKGKKKKDKGRKMEAGMLGFETGVKYDLLERADA